MSPDVLFGHTLQGLWLVGMLMLPMIVCAVVIGLIFSLVQALTQINEAALTLLLKLAGIGLVAVMTFPWMSRELQNFFLLSFSLAGKV